MSEYHQVLTCFLTVRRWFDSEREAGKDLVLHKLWADSVEPKRVEGGEENDLQAEHVRILEFGDKGSNLGIPGASVPFPWVTGPSSGALPSTMRLQDVGSTPRTLILQFQELYIQVEVQPHILCQPFSRDHWDLKILKATRKDRGFAVCTALDFGDAGVLSFLAPVGRVAVRIHWASVLKDLPCQAPDVYTEYSRFLQGVADWMLELPNKTDTDGTGLAIPAIQNAESVFGGMGPYTIIEVFYLAGLSPFLMEREVFRCPSRVARLCEAFWSLAHDAHTALPSFLSSYYHGYILAADKRQRSKFADHLHVYAKASSYMSSRMKELRDHYVSTVKMRTKQSDRPFLRNSVGGLFDVFEPTLIRAALEKPAPAPRLSHLTFGPIEWRVNGGTVPKHPDPLSKAFKKLGFPPDAATNLELSRYRSALFLPQEELKKTRSSVEVYQGQESSVPLWTITPRIPFDVVTTFRTGRKEQELRLVGDTERLIFRHIVENTSSYSVGPLEHCAIARAMESVKPENADTGKTKRGSGQRKPAPEKAAPAPTALDPAPPTWPPIPLPLNLVQVQPGFLVQQAMPPPLEHHLPHPLTYLQASQPVEQTRSSPIPQRSIEADHPQPSQKRTSPPPQPVQPSMHLSEFQLPVIERPHPRTPRASASTSALPHALEASEVPSSGFGSTTSDTLSPAASPLSLMNGSGPPDERGRIPPRPRFSHPFPACKTCHRTNVQLLHGGQFCRMCIDIHRPQPPPPPPSRPRYHQAASYYHHNHHAPAEHPISFIYWVPAPPPSPH